MCKIKKKVNSASEKQIEDVAVRLDINVGIQLISLKFTSGGFQTIVMWFLCLDRFLFILL